LQYSEVSAILFWHKDSGAEKRKLERLQEKQNVLDISLNKNSANERQAELSNMPVMIQVGLLIIYFFLNANIRQL
jgi:hypothetical protein